MASFANEVKNELARIYEVDTSCEKAELFALLKFGTYMVDKRMDFVSSNAAIARKVLYLIKKFYPNIHTEISAIRIKNLRKINRYYVKIYNNKSTNLFQKIKFDKIPGSYKAQTAYLRGAFLAKGTINRPQANYHMEITASSKVLCKTLQNIMQNLELPAKMFERNDELVVYLKNFDSILDFLYLIKAEQAIEKFESARNLKDIKIYVTRIMNCEEANLNRSINAAQKQIADVKKIFKHGIKLSNWLKETAEMRLKNPDLSMPDLAAKLFISTSTIKGRFAKIHQIAQNI